jgi:hypothetical protein
MRAERSRGSRIRSQNLPNELIKKKIRQECPAVPGISFFSRAAPQVAISEILARP